MADESCIKDLEVEWCEFLTKFHADNDCAKRRLRKVDLFPDQGLVCFILYNVFLPEECQFIISSIEDIGFNKLLYGENYRTNTRTQITQRSLANEMFVRIQGNFLPKQWPGSKNTSHWELMGLNERIRICKYESGQYFAPHFDGTFKRNYMEQSQMTVMVYLNDSFTGGHTNFLNQNVKPTEVTYALKPETAFQHEIFHEGQAVSTGKKYIMRTDAMYRRALVEPMSQNEQEARESLSQAENFEDQSNYEEATKYYRRAYKLWPSLETEFNE